MTAPPIDRALRSLLFRLRPIAFWAVAVIATIAVPAISAQEPKSKVKIVHLNPEAVEVSDAGRQLGRTPQTIELFGGVHRLRIGQTEHCIVLRSGSAAEIILSAGVIELLSGALRCADAWSEIVVEGVPSDVTVRTSDGTVTRRGGGAVVVRVALPTRVVLDFAGSRYLSFSSKELEVEPAQVGMYQLTLGPPAPGLLADSIAEELPAAPTVPPPPVIAPTPIDPATDLSAAESRLAAIRSRGGAEAASSVGTWTFLGGVLSSLVSFIAVNADSMNTKPELRTVLGVSVAVATIGYLLDNSSTSSLERKAKAARCTPPHNKVGRKNCQARLESEVEGLRTSQRSFPARRAEWDVAKRVADSVHAVQVRDHELRVEEWTRATLAAERRNESVAANRRQNDSALTSWRNRARGSQSLLVIRKTSRPSSR